MPGVAKVNNSGWTGAFGVVDVVRGRRSKLQLAALLHSGPAAKVRINPGLGIVSPLVLLLLHVAACDPRPY